MLNRNIELFRNAFSPARELDRWLEEIDRAPWFSTTPMTGSKLTWNPNCELTETSTHYEMKFDLPGVPKEQIKIDLQDNNLTVSGERKEEKKEETNKSHFSEMYYGSFMRSFMLPTKVDPEKVDAKYENGILSIQIPKNTPAQARHIPVS